MIKKNFIEEHYCDCCGKKIDNIDLAANRYSNEVVENDKIETLACLPYITETEIKNTWTHSVRYEIKILKVEDMCNDCFYKLIGFIEELTPNVQKQFILDRREK